MSDPVQAKMDSVLGSVEKHETIVALNTDLHKHGGVALKSDHDKLGLRASAWRFKKVSTILPLFLAKSSRGPRLSLCAIFCASPLRAMATKSTSMVSVAPPKRG